MKRIAIALFVVLGSACGCSSKSPPPATQPAPPPSSEGSPSNTEPPTSQSGSAATGPGIGEKCGDNDACAAPATCVSYYGIAGARGPEFKTCEVKCEDDSACPSGRKCATIADGPGRVCR